MAYIVLASCHEYEIEPRYAGFRGSIHTIAHFALIALTSLITLAYKSCQ